MPVAAALARLVVANRGYSIVDPFLLVLYRWGNRIGLPMREGYPAWTGIVRRVSTRPAAQRAMANEGVFLDR